MTKRLRRSRAWSMVRSFLFGAAIGGLLIGCTLAMPTDAISWLPFRQDPIRLIADCEAKPNHFAIVEADGRTVICAEGSAQP